MASLTYNLGRKEILDGTIDLGADVIKAMLVTSSYVANVDNDFVDDAGANDPIDHELSGTGYAAGFAGAGRKTLGSIAITEDDTNDTAEFNAANLTWTGIDAGTAAAVIIYRHLTSDALSTMIAYIDTGGFPVVTNSGDLTITWNAEGIIQLT
jgi:hypothetical protein